jgi:Icc-related predicted phosphoesterase
MKFLAFVDAHEDEALHSILTQKIDLHEVDFILCLGDFTWFGNALKEELEFINNMGKPVYLFHGNHEPHEKTKELCAEFDNITFVHKEFFEHEKVLFVCYGGGGFAQQEPVFEKWITENKEKIHAAEKIVLATHAPPLDTKLDEVMEGYNVGIESYRAFIDEFHPILAISGHIHESVKLKQVLNKTLLVNPGGDGEIFEL